MIVTKVVQILTASKIDMYAFNFLYHLQNFKKEPFWKSKIIRNS